MSEPRILLEQESPNANVLAVVEEDGQTVYFYLFHEERGERVMRAVWVRNLGEAPAEEDTESMQAGRAPRLPAWACDHPEGKALPAPEQLRLVWFEEGDSAALLDSEGVLAVLPAWAGTEGFPGYARDCRVPSIAAWPLRQALPAMQERVERADSFASLWRSPDTWSTYRDQMIQAYEHVLGPHTNYYAADAGTWPPRAVLRFAREDAVIAATLGMSLRPQPRVEMATPEPGKLRRVELAVAVAPSLLGANERPLLEWLSAQTTVPWSNFTWLGHGHTISCSALPPLPSGVKLTSMLLQTSPAGAPEIRLPDFRDDPVNLLWCVPLTECEQRQATTAGSTTVSRRLAAQGATWIARPREPLPERAGLLDTLRQLFPRRRG